MVKNNIVEAMSAFCMVFFCLISVSFYVTNAADPPPLQNFCVGVNDYKSSGWFFQAFYFGKWDSLIR